MWSIHADYLPSMVIGYNGTSMLWGFLGYGKFTGQFLKQKVYVAGTGELINGSLPRID
jgi:hypothetical protein